MHWPIGRGRGILDGLMGKRKEVLLRSCFGGPRNRLHTLPLIAVV